VRVLISEHFTGGGCAGDRVPRPIAAQGYAMVTAALRAFRACACHTTVLHDVRISPDAFPADEHIAVGPGRYRGGLRRGLRAADAVLIIAPESGGLLAALTASVEREGPMLLGATTEAVRIAGDKLRLARALGEAGVCIPRTVAVPSGEVHAALREMGLPAVIKPRAGAGGEGVSVIRRPADISPAMARLRRTGAHVCLVQQWIPGVHASVSLIGNGRQARPLTLNRQMIQGAVALSYHGGIVPYQHPQQDAAFALAAAACAAIPGLRGYVGVDVILGGDGPVVIEVNPRWTTACVALEHLLHGSLARAILDAVRRGALPRQLRLTGRVRFDLPAWQRTFARVCGRPRRAGDQ